MADRLSIKFNDPDTHNRLSARVDHAFKRALALESKLPSSVFEIDGMSGRNYRMFVNNLVEKTDDARYLEVGSWAGSTACSAIAGNSVKAVCIDNWSQFGGPKDLFDKNVANTLAVSPNVDFQLIEKDFRQVSYSTLGTFNIYLFDGPHLKQDHYDGLALALPALDGEFIFIVDDWNWANVREGTREAISNNGLKVVSSIELRTTQDDTHSSVVQKNSDWHNGYFLSVISKL